MDIVITKDNFQNLADIIIANMTSLDYYSMFWWQQHMQWQLLLETKHNRTQNKHQGMISFPLP
jgi:hypothetical protein